MLVSEIESRFYTEYDEFQSDYISADKLTLLAWHAQNNVFNNNLIPSYQSTKRISEDLLPLKKFQTISAPSSNEINLSGGIADFNSLIILTPTYTVSGTTYTNPATLLLDVDKNSTYAKGTLRYPKYEQYTDSNSDTILLLRPSNTPTQVEIEYFRTPIPIDFNSPNDNIPYTDNAIGLIIDTMKQLAAEAFRDPEFFNTSSAMLQQDQTPNI